MTIKQHFNTYIAEYNGKQYPTLTLAAKAANIKRTTLNKAVMKLASQGLDEFQVECVGAQFKISCFRD